MNLERVMAHEGSQILKEQGHKFEFPALYNIMLLSGAGSFHPTKNRVYEDVRQPNTLALRSYFGDYGGGLSK